MFARLVKRGSEYYLVIKVVAGARTARVRLSELGRRGALIGRITLVVGTGKETVRLPFVVARRGSGLRHDGHLDAADGAGRRGAQGTATAG